MNAPSYRRWALRFLDGSRAGVARHRVQRPPEPAGAPAERLRERIGDVVLNRVLEARKSAPAAQVPPAVLADQIGLSLPDPMSAVTPRGGNSCEAGSGTMRR
jgi:hypothetical protein